MTIIIDREFQVIMFKMQPEEYDRLEQSILTEGCRDALVIWNGILIDGYNRYTICQKHNIEFATVEMEFPNRDEAKRWIRSNQLARRNLTKEQRDYLIGLEYKERKQTGFKGNQYTQGGSPQNEDKQKTSEKIADEYKVSKATVERAEKFADAVDIISENVGDDVRDEILARELDVTAKDVQILAKQKPEVQKEVIKKVRSGKSIKRAIKETNKTETPPLPVGKYRVIYADPPWQYNNTGLDGAAENHYSTMSLEDISQLKDGNGRKITDISAENSVLFLWVTSPFLPEGLEVCKKWGFDYKTSFIWVKDKETYGKLGFYTYSQHEFLFVAVKGSCLPEEGSLVPSIISATKSNHSRKPEIVYELIEKMYPLDLNKPIHIELFARLTDAKGFLFARNARNGWDGWGIEYVCPLDSYDC